MTRKQWCLLGVAIIGLGSVAWIGTVAKPMAETYVAPIIKEQVNTSVNGTVNYDSLSIDSLGSVSLCQVTVDDTNGHRIATAPTVDVSIDLLKLPIMLLNGTSGASLISTITVENPEVHLWELQNKNWNIQELIKTNTSSSGEDVKSAIAVKGGTVIARTYDGNRYELNDVNGTVSFSNNPVIDGAITAVLDGQDITVRGNLDMDNTKKFSLYAQADQIKVAYANEALKGRDDIILTDGFVKNVNVTVIGDGTDYSISGHLRVEGLSGIYTYDDTAYGITNGQGKLAFNNHDIIISKSTWIVNDQPINVDGIVTLNDKDPLLNLNVTGKNLNIASLVDVGVTGRIGADVHISGTSAASKVQGTISGSDVTYSDYTIDQLSADVAYDDDVVSVGNLKAAIGEGTLSGRGLYSVKDSTWEGQVDGNKLDLSTFTKATGTIINGSVSGSVHATGEGRQILSMVGDVSVMDVNYKGIGFDIVNLHVTGDGKKYSTGELTAHSGNGSLSAYGTLEGGQLNINFNGKDIPASMASAFMNQNVTGQLTAYGTVIGSTDNPTVEAHISSDTIHVDNARYNHLLFEGGLKNHVITISRGHIIDGDGGYSVTGTLGTDGNSPINLIVDAESVRLENAIRSFVDFPITGWVSATNQVTGTINNPIVQGQVNMWDGSVYEKLVSNVQASYIYQNNVLSIPDATVIAYGATINGAGKLMGRNLDFNFVGDKIDIGRLLDNTDVEIDGYAALQGKLTGTIDKPVFEGSGRSTEMLVNGVPITNVVGDIYADPTVINLQEFSFNEGGNGFYNVKGGVSLDDEHRLFGIVKVSNGSVKGLIHMLHEDTDDFDGYLDGMVELGGTLKNPSVAVKGTVDNVRIVGTNVGNATVDVGLANRKLTITKLELPVDGGLIAAGGFAFLDGESQMQIAVNKVDVTPFLSLIGKNINATGQVSAVMNITGKTNNPKVELSAELENGSYNSISLDRAFALATMENKVINIQRVMGMRGPYKLSLYGKLPLAALYTSGYLPPGDNNAMDVTVDFNEADLGIVPLMTPMVTEGTGALKGTVKITGTSEQPEVRGTVSVRNGTLAFKNIGKPLEKINGDLIFTGTTGDFQSDMVMGKGNAGLVAKINWAGHSITSYRAALQLDNLEMDSEYIKGPLNGELYISEKDGLPILAGVINLENNTFKIPLSFESGESTTNLGLNVTVHAGKKVRLYDKMLYDMLIEGAVNFAGTVQRPDPSGSFNVQAGTFKYLSHVFTITKGTANFVDRSFLPNLVLEAENTTSNYNIKLGVTGTVDKLDMTLTSEPYLSKNRIISLLTFGRGTETNSSAVTSQDANALVVSGVQMLAFGYVQDALHNTLGLDLINITTGSLDPHEPANDDTAGNYNIEIGKYLLPKMMLTYSQGLNNSSNRYGVQYSIPHNLKLNAWHTSTGNTYFGGRWTKEF